MLNYARHLALALVLFCSAFAAQAQVVISQAWGGAGSSGATHDRDYVELFNRGSAPVSLSGLSVQYASATGTGNFALASTLPAFSLQPGQRFLVGLATGTGTTTLPTPDATGTTNLSGSAGKVALVNSTAALGCNGGSAPCSGAQLALLVDLVGYGTANFFEGSGAAPAASASLAVFRGANGCTDSNNNASDFATGAPNPRNSSAALAACATGTPALSISDKSTVEGDSGQQGLSFTLTLSAPAGPGGVSFTLTTTAGTATDGEDYLGHATGQVGSIEEGRTQSSFLLAVLGDTTEEADETLTATLSNISGATAGDVEAIGTILDDDTPVTPTLTIADLTIDEGDNGTRTASFTVLLSSSAPPQGVTFDIATADDTATTGDGDYVAKALTGQVIPGNGGVYEFQVTVNSDTAVEPNESFLVNVTNVTGANVGDGQARATIVSDDFAITAIHDIQGAGATSPLVGQSVTTVGIVTGRKSNGFFLQAANDDADANPATSEGVYVFTGAAPPAQATVANRVRVAGTVIEFIPAADPGQLPFTEISNTTSIVQLSTGHPMPTPVQLTTTFPNPANPALDQLEPVEGMRVTAASFTVVAPTRGNVNEPNATATSNGQINLVVTGVARPLREAGIQNPDPAPGGGSIPPIPRWDFNPELMFSDTDGIGAPRLDLAAGATLTNYVGPMDYGFRRYSIYPDPAITPVIVQPAPTAARLPLADEFTVASYNLERFFDTVNDAGTDDPVLTATAYANRLNKASLGIRNFVNTPDILGVVETEKLSVLQDLAARINADAVTAGQPNPQYVAYLQEGNDIGGIDNGLLVKTAEVAANVDRVEVLAVTQLGKDTILTNPDNSTDLLNDRPPLQLDAKVHYADGREFPITVIVVHQRSLSGADGDDANGERVRNKRQKQAEYLAGVVQAMQVADANRNITLVGDFNAFEFNDGLVDAMAVVRGIAFPDNTTAVPGDGADLVTTDLLNLASEETPDQRYSFVFDGTAQSLDHILINQALGASVSGFDLDHARINADFPSINRNDANSASRLSDHDPAVAYFAASSADLSVTASASPATVPVGGTMTFSATVSNEGPDAASFPGIGFAFDAELPGLAITAPAGWTCDVPVVGGGQTSASCANSTSLANAATAAFQLTAVAPAGEVGNAINMAVAVSAQTEDPELDNNDAAAAINVVTTSELGIVLTGPSLLYRTSTSANYVATTTLGGPADPASPVVTLAINVPVAAVTLFASSGWTCTTAPTGTFSAACESATQGTAPVFTMAINGVGQLRLPRINVRAEIQSDSHDPQPGNNEANFSTRVVGTGGGF